MLVHQYEVEIFTTQQGKEPFSEWFQNFNPDPSLESRHYLY
jgi:hypothetical protein